MDIKEAVAKAKAFVAETFADEDPSNSTTRKRPGISQSGSRARGKTRR
jgi:hypothetical protein